MLISQIVAFSRNRVIGSGGQIPWDLPGDLQRFKRITLGHTLLLGRKTFEAIGRPLPGRRTIVVSRQPSYSADGVAVVSSIEAGISLAEASGEGELFICGGEQLYRQTLDLVQRLYLSELELECAGDAFYPLLPDGTFEKILSRCYSEQSNYTFAIWQRLDCKDALEAELLATIDPE
jgi:dihydrofolate reductase